MVFCHLKSIKFQVVVVNLVRDVYCSRYVASKYNMKVQLLHLDSSYVPEN